jgi:hypothetical protein
MIPLSWDKHKNLRWSEIFTEKVIKKPAKDYDNVTWIVWRSIIDLRLNKEVEELLIYEQLIHDKD